MAPTQPRYTCTTAVPWPGPQWEMDWRVTDHPDAEHLGLSRDKLYSRYHCPHCDRRFSEEVGNDRRGRKSRASTGRDAQIRLPFSTGDIGPVNFDDLLVSTGNVE